MRQVNKFYFVLLSFLDSSNSLSKQFLERESEAKTGGVDAHPHVFKVPKTSILRRPDRVINYIISYIMAYVSLKSSDGLRNLYADLNLGSEPDSLGHVLESYADFKTIGDVALLEDTQASLGYHFVKMFPDQKETFEADPQQVIHTRQWTQLKSLVIHARELVRQATKNRYELESKEEGVPVSHIGKKTMEVTKKFNFLILDDTTPGQKVWRILSNQIERRSFHFIPWSKWASLEDERRSNPSDAGRRLRVTEKNDIEIVDSEDVASNLRGFARIQQICTMRKVLYVSEELCMPISVDFWTQKLMKAFAPQRLHPQTRAPNFKELEEADRLFWSEVFRLAAQQNDMVLDLYMKEAMNYPEVVAELNPRVDVTGKASNHGGPKTDSSDKTPAPKPSPKHTKGSGKGVKKIPSAAVKKLSTSKSAIKNRKRREAKAAAKKAAITPVKQESVSKSFFPHLTKLNEINKNIKVFDGACVRDLRDGGGVLSPGILAPTSRPLPVFWSNCLSTVSKIADQVFNNKQLNSPSCLFKESEKISSLRFFFYQVDWCKSSRHIDRTTVPAAILSGYSQLYCPIVA